MPVARKRKVTKSPVRRTRSTSSTRKSPAKRKAPAKRKPRTTYVKFYDVPKGMIGPKMRNPSGGARKKATAFRNVKDFKTLTSGRQIYAHGPQLPAFYEKNKSIYKGNSAKMSPAQKDALVKKVSAQLKAEIKSLSKKNSHSGGNFWE